MVVGCYTRGKVLRLPADDNSRKANWSTYVYTPDTTGDIYASNKNIRLYIFSVARLASCKRLTHVGRVSGVVEHIDITRCEGLETTLDLFAGSTTDDVFSPNVDDDPGRVAPFYRVEAAP